MTEFPTGGIPARKIIAVPLGIVTVGGGLLAGTIGVRLSNPTGKLRFSIEMSDNDGGRIVALNPNSNWTGRSVINGQTIAPNNIFTAQPLPDSFEAVTAGTLFQFVFTVSCVAVAAAGVSGLTALCTWEPVDPQMSDVERRYWFGLCKAVVDGPLLNLRTA